MEIQGAFLLSAAVFALLQFGFLPRLKKTWSRLPLDKQLKRFGVLALLDKLRDYSLVAGLCLFGFAIYILAISSHLGGSSDAILKVLTRAKSANESIVHFKSIWSTWIFFFSFLLLWLAWLRSAKSFAKETLTDLRLKEYNRLAKLRDEHPDAWQDLPPTAEMNVISNALQKTMQEVENDRASGLSSDQIAQKIAYARKLSEIWTFLDFDRRLAVEWDTQPVSPKGKLSAAKQFITSRGFLSDMKGIGSILSYASSGLLTLSMIGFAATAANNSLKNDIAHLSDLVITSSARESDVLLRSAEEQIGSTNSPTNKHLTNQDHQYIRDLSHDLAKEVRGDARWSHSDTNLRYELAKEQIRAETVLSESTTAPENTTTPEDLVPLARTDAVEDALAGKIEGRLTAEAERTPGFIEKLRHWRARYKDPASIDELRSYFVEQVTDTLFNVLPKPPTPLSAKTADLFAMPLKNSANEILETGMNTLMVSIIRDVPDDQTWTGIQRKASLDSLLRPDDLGRIRQEYPNIAAQEAWADSLHVRRVTALSREDPAIGGHIEEALSKVPSWFAVDNQESLADLVSTYEAQFPLIEKSYWRDDLFNAISKVRDDEKAHGVELADIQDSDNITERAARAENIEALRNYSRVGGVLIGALPVSGDPVHITDIVWTQSAGGFGIVLIKPDGSQFVVGTFDPDLINRALAYAIDGRPAAVTVLRADLIERDQVMMHPSIRDSILGAQLGRADEWVFDFLDPDNGVSPNGLRKAMTALEGATHLYNKALVLEQTGKSGPQEGRFAILHALTTDLAVEELANSKAFDRHLVAVTEVCMDRSHAELDFTNCVVGDHSDPVWKARIVKFGKRPRTEFVSQIYERPYRIEPTLGFLRNQSGGDGIWPLRFTAQMTINDQEHITFPQFQAGLLKAQSTSIVLAGVHESGEDALLQRLRDFTILQRLFRLALSGEFGNEFPVEKLAVLARDTHAPKSPCPTPRWIHRKMLTVESMEQSMGKYLDELPPSSAFENPAPSQISADARARFKTCSKMLAPSDSDEISAAQVESTCSLSAIRSSLFLSCRAHPSNGTEACILLDMDRDLDAIAAIHQLREGLGAVAPPSHIQPVCSL